jgi:hypothetical protein
MRPWGISARVKQCEYLVTQSRRGFPLRVYAGRGRHVMPVPSYCSLPPQSTAIWGRCFGRRRDNRNNPEGRKRKECGHEKFHSE